MTRRAAILTALVLQAAFTQRVSAQADAGFAGEWRPVTEKPAIASVRIAQGRAGWTVQAFGACQPKPCDWGTVPFTILEQRPKGSGLAVGFATWRQGSATRIMTFRLGEDSLLIEIYNLFSGPKDQPAISLSRNWRAPFDRLLPARLRPVPSGERRTPEAHGSRLPGVQGARRSHRPRIAGSPETPARRTGGGPSPSPVSTRVSRCDWSQATDHDWVLQPWQYDDASDLRAGMAAHVVKPAERKARELVARRAAAGGALQPATR